jgi:hypothetical protein
MRATVLIVSIALVPLPAFAQADESKYPKCNGDWWLSLDPVVQASYILGAMDGIQASGWFEIQSMQTETYEKIQRQKDEAIYGVSNLDLARNVTGLYRDHPEWRDISVSSAVWLASMQLHGVRDAQLKDAVATIRQHKDR